jgi:hypothetical protein
LEERTVGHTFYFLTATWLAAQGADPKDIWSSDISPCGCQQTYSDNYVHAVGSWAGPSSSGCGCNQPTVSGGYEEHHNSFLERIQSRLSGLAHLWPFRHQADEGVIYQGEDSGAMVQSSSPGQPMPSARSGEPPLADHANQPAQRAPVAPTDFHPEPPAAHGLLIEPEPN